MERASFHDRLEKASYAGFDSSTPATWYVIQDEHWFGPFWSEQVLSGIASHRIDCSAEITCERIGLKPTPVNSALKRLLHCYIDECETLPYHRSGSPRVAILGDAVIKSDRRLIDARCFDISSSGFRFDTFEPPFQPGTCVEVVIRGSRLDQPILAHGEVERLFRIGVNQYGCAMSFLRMEPSGRLQLLTFIEKELLYPLELALRLGNC